jgi:hypothetical protein
VFDAGVDGVIINMPGYVPGAITQVGEALRPCWRDRGWPHHAARSGTGRETWRPSDYRGEGPVHVVEEQT